MKLEKKKRALMESSRRSNQHLAGEVLPSEDVFVRNHIPFLHSHMLKEIKAYMFGLGMRG